MTSASLENLARIGQLKAEPPDAREIRTLVEKGRLRLKDAQNGVNSLESRFDLAYSAAHAFALAALRRQGYRSENRYVVFQLLPQTAGASNAEWRLLDLCHKRRNAMEYHGEFDVDEKLLASLIEVALKILAAVG